MRLLDLCCKAGGAAMGYERAGFETVGVDIEPQPRYPFEFVQVDALEYLAEHGHEFDAIHASPPCQGYSIMHNLPWLRDREYPLLILSLIEMLEGLGKPYVLENVMGARFGSKTLSKRGLEAHGLSAGWLCGAMFGLPFYRHRLFAANWLWLAPGHPKHIGRVTVGPSGQKNGRGISEQIVTIPTKSGNFDPNYREKHPNPVNTAWRETHDGGSPKAPDGRARFSDRNPMIGTGGQTGAADHMGSLSNWQNGAQAEGVGLGHAKGWRLAAEAMGIDWMNRAELTQAIPPVYTEHIGRQLAAMVRYTAMEDKP